MDEYVLKKLELIKAKWKEKNDFQEKGVISVSYTHLTLPTNSRV